MLLKELGELFPTTGHIHILSIPNGFAIDLTSQSKQVWFCLKSVDSRTIISVETFDNTVQLSVVRYWIIC